MRTLGLDPTNPINDQENTHPAAFPPHFLGDGDRIAWKLAQPTDPDCHPENTASCGPSAKHSNAAQHSTRHKPPQQQAPFRQLNRGQHHQPPRILLTVPEAARVLAISRSKLYELLVSGEVRSLRIGGSRR
ncbi:MAG: excisionase family DNA-binding protein [Thermobifida fusca]|uniref:excisionase family DNA-binding protein n=1 Tax=Thermobifida TaxID=83677 RepID=UPI00257D3CDD|nr:excisionase family DNA-binding protein [Thermobifida sp.]